MSRICDQRKLNQPLRMISTFLSAANWRATASMPKVPLPGTMATERAWYTVFNMDEMSFITVWKFFDM